MPDRIDTTMTGDTMATADAPETRRRELIDRLVECTPSSGSGVICFSGSRPYPG